MASVNPQPTLRLGTNLMSLPFATPLPQVSTKDAIRFRHLLGTWIDMRVFPTHLLDEFQSLFLYDQQQPTAPHAPISVPATAPAAARTQAHLDVPDLPALRDLLRQMQDAEGVPLERQLTVEEVREHNPALFETLRSMLPRTHAPAASATHHAVSEERLPPPAPQPAVSLCLSRRYLARWREDAPGAMYKQRPYTSSGHRFQSKQEVRIPARSCTHVPTSARARAPARTA